MKPIITILLLLIQLTTYSQSSILKLIENGSSLENIIPSDWKILSSTKGDLNKDGIEDIAFAIQNTDPSNYEINEGLGIDTIDLNPRILGIYFGNPDGGFSKTLQSNEFIILQSPTMDEPFDSVRITDKGLLKIDFHIWYNAGSWSMSYNTYQFRYQNDQFELIQYESDEMHRGTGEGSYYKIDFLKKRMEVINSEFDEEKDKEKTRKKCKKFKLEKLKSIRTLQQPFEWEFNEIYI